MKKLVDFNKISKEKLYELYIEEVKKYDNTAPINIMTAHIKH